MKTNAKIKNHNFEDTVDYFNFNSVNTDFKILDIINERFTRDFRVTVSQRLKNIVQIKHSLNNLKFKDWIDQHSEISQCFSIVRLNHVKAPILIKLDRNLSYGMIDLLSGGDGENSQVSNEKEFTMIELSLLKEIVNDVVDSLNDAWKPVVNIQAEYIRLEVNPNFIGIVPEASKVRVVEFVIEFASVKGVLQIVYPYSTLFPLRNLLFSV